MRRLVHFFAISALLASSALADQTVTITTLKGQMRYDKARFSVQPGEKVKLVLKNEDDMHHNLIITKPRSDKGMAVAMKAWELGADGFAKHWIPEHEDILFASKMADPQKQAVLEFTAPKQVGNYPYVCTLPGHAQIMNGVMAVTKKKPTPLSELTFVTYKGKWEALPDFSQLKPTGTDHVASGLFDLAATKEKDAFGIVFDGTFNAEKEGEYEFVIGSDDGSRLSIDGNPIITNDGIHPMKEKSGKTRLSAGPHDIKVEYFEGGGQEALYVGYKGPGMKKHVALSKQTRTRGGGGAPPTGLPLVAEKEARIYRNFIEGAGPRAIGVGYPGGLNLAYDANNMRIALLWRGEFIDAARHWNGRGQGFQPPLAEEVSMGAPGVPFAVLSDSKLPWPNTFLRKDNAEQPKLEGGYVFKGYTLYGDERIPSFNFTFQGRPFEQTPIPVKNNKANRTTISNTFAITGSPIPGLHYRAAVADTIEANPDGSFSVGSDLMMSFSDAQNSLKPFVRKSEGKTELLVPISVGVFKQAIRWQ